MEKSKFVKELTNLINLKKKQKAITLMKCMWIKISLFDAKALVDQATVYHFEKNVKSFPKEIDGVLYASAGEYIYSKFNEEQKEQVKKCKWIF